MNEPQEIRVGQLADEAKKLAMRKIADKKSEIESIVEAIGAQISVSPDKPVSQVRHPIHVRILRPG